MCVRGVAGWQRAGEGVKFFVFRLLFRPALVFRLSLIFSSLAFFFLVPHHMCARAVYGGKTEAAASRFRFGMETQFETVGEMVDR